MCFLPCSFAKRGRIDRPYFAGLSGFKIGTEFIFACDAQPHRYTESFGRGSILFAAHGEEIMMRFRILLTLLALGGVLAAKSRKEIPPAPLPAIVVSARTVFLTNGGGSDLAYDAFYSSMKTWGKYQIVGSPDEADLIVELGYHVEHGGTRVWSSTNTYNTTQVHSAQIVDPQVVLTIYDAKTKNSLWSTVDHRRLARLEKNREKETINSAERLVEELKMRTQAP